MWSILVGRDFASGDAAPFTSGRDVCRRGGRGGTGPVTSAPPLRRVAGGGPRRPRGPRAPTGRPVGAGDTAGPRRPRRREAPRLGRSSRRNGTVSTAGRLPGLGPSPSVEGSRRRGSRT